MGKYLGLPEHFGRRKRDLFTSIVDRIRQTAQSLSARHLSRAGRMIMIKAVLTAIPSYATSCFLLPVSLCKRIQSVLTRFWWDGNSETRKLCWIAWDKLTKSKKEGGLGFRDIQTFNHAMLAKISWRILTQPDCLLARVLKGKYCHKQNFLDVTAPASCSHGWRGILCGRDLLKTQLGKAIGNGLNTRVWKDSWISLSEYVKPFGPITEDMSDLTVSELLTTEMKWNEKRIKEVLPDFASNILLLQPSQTGAEDQYIWQPTSTGVYSAKSGYHALKAMEATGPRDFAVPASEFDWIKDIWAGNMSPKLRVFTWSIIQNALPLGVNLKRRGLMAAANCIRCGEEETTTHIFFHCPYAQNVWQEIPTATAVHIAASSDFKTVMLQSRNLTCLPPSGVPGNILMWVCWALWNARNQLVFENRILSSSETALKAILSANE